MRSLDITCINWQKVSKDNLKHTVEKMIPLGRSKMTNDVSCLKNLTFFSLKDEPTNFPCFNLVSSSTILTDSTFRSPLGAHPQRLPLFEKCNDTVYSGQCYIIGFMNIMGLFKFFFYFLCPFSLNAYNHSIRDINTSHIITLVLDIFKL